MLRTASNTIDNLSTFTNIIEIRKLSGKPTFTAFIDFKKAYDSINRTLLFTKNKQDGLIQEYVLNIIVHLQRCNMFCLTIWANNGLVHSRLWAKTRM